MKVYEAIVRGLESAGVEVAFGGNGENIAGLALALEDAGHLRPVLTRHEQAAAFMACGYSMFTGRLGVCFATVGPGAFNLLTGLGMALSDCYPVLAVTGYVALPWRGMGAVNDTSGLNGTPDSQAMFAATTKRSFLLTDAADTCDMLEEAVNTALAGRPGPVHIHVPQNLTERGVEVGNYHDVRVRVEPVRPDPARVREAATVLAEALRAGRRIVALVGYGAVQSGAGSAVRRFLERFQIPLLTTLDGKGIVSESHPLCVGVFHESGHASALKAFREADVVVAIGNSLSQHATFGLREDLFAGKVLVRINIDEREFDKLYQADHALVADARLAVTALTDALDPLVGPLPERTVDGRDYEARHLPQLTKAIHPGRLAQRLGRMLPPDAILLADAGAHLAWLGYYVELEDGQNFRKCGSFGPMAGHTNGAIGVQLAHPGRTVVVGCGDGCYAMSGFELLTAVEHDAPVIWVIFDDSEFKLVKLYQLATYGRSGLVEYRTPDFAAYARACGADGYRVEDLEEFEEAFAAALAARRPTVIDARITRWALPHYYPSPRGLVHGVVEELEKRFGKD
ncbi:thiamine pyrophosphate-binding protein [Geodermatophilus sp. URMC 64]